MSSRTEGQGAMRRPAECEGCLLVHGGAHQRMTELHPARDDANEAGLLGRAQRPDVHLEDLCSATNQFESAGILGRGQVGLWQARAAVGPRWRFGWSRDVVARSG
jgi:hypothetical protein